MTEFTPVIARLLARSFYAVNDKPMFGDSPTWAAKVFETLLPYVGLDVIWTGGLLVQDGIGDRAVKFVAINDDGSISAPDVGQSFSPDVARQLGQALIAASRMAEQ